MRFSPLYDLQLAEDRRVFGNGQTREHRELGQRAQRLRRARRLRQRRGLQHLVVDAHLFVDTQAVRHLDEVHAVDESLIVLVVAELQPLGFVRVRHDETVERQRRQRFGALEVAFLGGCQDRVEHLKRRLEHLDELDAARRTQTQRARVAVRVRIVLRELLQHAQVDLADQRRDVLRVLVARLRLDDADLVQHRRHDADDLELGQIALEFLQALQRPRAGDAGQCPARNAIAVFHLLAELVAGKQSQWRLEQRGDLARHRVLQRIDRELLAQRLDLLRQRRLAATDRTEQIQHLLAFLETLSGVKEVRVQRHQRLFHAMEVREHIPGLDDAILEDARQTRIVGSVDKLGLADRLEHAFVRAGVCHAIALAVVQEVFDSHLFVHCADEGVAKRGKQLGGRVHLTSLTRGPTTRKRGELRVVDKACLDTFKRRANALHCLLPRRIEEVRPGKRDRKQSSRPPI